MIKTEKTRQILKWCLFTCARHQISRGQETRGCTKTGPANCFPYSRHQLFEFPHNRKLTDFFFFSSHTIPKNAYIHTNASVFVTLSCYACHALWMAWRIYDACHMKRVQRRPQRSFRMEVTACVSYLVFRSLAAPKTWRYVGLLN